MYLIKKIKHWLPLTSSYFLRSVSSTIMYDNINKFGSLLVKCPSASANICAIDPQDFPSGGQAIVSVSDVSAWESIKVDYDKELCQLKVEENGAFDYKSAVITIQIPHNYNISANAHSLFVSESESKNLYLFSAQDCTLGKIKSLNTHVVCHGNFNCKSMLSNANVQSKGSVIIGKIQAQEVFILASDDIQVDSIYCASSKICSTSGSVSIKNAHGILDVATKSGFISIRSLDGDLRATTTSGNIDALIEICNQRVNINSTSGNIKVGLSDKVSASIEADGATVDVDEEVLFDGLKQHISNEQEKFEGKVGNGKSEILVFSKTGIISFSKQSWFSNLNAS